MSLAEIEFAPDYNPNGPYSQINEANEDPESSTRNRDLSSNPADKKRSKLAGISSAYLMWRRNGLFTLFVFFTLWIDDGRKNPALFDLDICEMSYEEYLEQYRSAILSSNFA